MERLTDRFDDMTIGVINAFANDDLIDIPEYVRGPIVTASICNAIERLAEYEDTGLTPQKIICREDYIKLLQTQNKEFREEIYKLREQCDYWKTEALNRANELGE